VSQDERRLLIVGVDPGSGISSPTGLAIFYPDTKDPIHVEEVGTEEKELAHRLRSISAHIGDLLLSLDPDGYDVRVYIESFVMRGKSGETLARLVGALMASVPYEIRVGFVQNTTVKKNIAGHGHATKAEVAQGLLKWAKGSRRMEALVRACVRDGNWDAVDALAIGVAGYERDFTS
jgi:Holliday junction resolvasome RuvABC endonuclease subunit